VFWVGEAMETFLVKPLRALAGNVKVIELRQTPGLTLLPAREGTCGKRMSTALTMAVPMTATASPSTSKDEVKLDRADADHGPAETDMHIWLDPEKAVLAAAIAPALAAADPSNAAVYQANPDSLRQRLDELDRSLGRPNRAEGLPPAGFSSIGMDRPAKSLASGAASVRHWSQAAPRWP
jgi:zinc transport system substrate-binding protein